jgi:hypothetical protein
VFEFLFRYGRGEARSRATRAVEPYVEQVLEASGGSVSSAGVAGRPAAGERLGTSRR